MVRFNIGASIIGIPSDIICSTKYWSWAWAMVFRFENENGARIMVPENNCAAE